MPTPKGAMCQPPLYNALAQWQDTSTIAFFQAGRQLLRTVEHLVSYCCPVCVQTFSYVPLIYSLQG